MIVGVPKEIKNNEFRVAITPAGVREFVKSGHTVLIEQGAGLGSALPDSEYQAQGAQIVASADDVWQKADLVLKVKEPIAAEYSRMRKGQVLFTYLHLAASRECTDALIKSGITAIAYETVEVDGALPLLAPMSEVAGRMSVKSALLLYRRATVVAVYFLAVCLECVQEKLLSLVVEFLASLPQLLRMECAQTSQSLM